MKLPIHRGKNMYLKKTDYNHLLKINQNMNSFLLLKIKKNISTLNLPIHLGLFTFAFLVLLVTIAERTEPLLNGGLPMITSN